MVARDLEALFVRADIACDLHNLPASCPADLHGWVQRGYVVTEDEFGNEHRSAVPDTASGVACAMEAATHKHGCCWCGRWRSAGRELTDGRA